MGHSNVVCLGVYLLTIPKQREKVCEQKVKKKIRSFNPVIWIKVLVLEWIAPFFLLPSQILSSLVMQKCFFSDTIIYLICFLCSCGSCGYELNLNSSSRNTASIGSKYGKSIKKGMISFLSIDESRFTQVDEFKCVPFFFSKRSWGLFQRRTKLQCRKCGNDIGIAYDDSASSYPLVADASDTASGSEITTHRKYDIKIRSLQPSSSASGTPLPE